MNRETLSYDIYALRKNSNVTFREIHGRLTDQVRLERYIVSATTKNVAASTAKKKLGD